MHSALYRGSVVHSRTSPVNHSFRYSVTMVYLDLAEVPGLVRSLHLLGMRRWAPAAFLEKDHRLDEGHSLDAEIRDTVQRAANEQLTGPIRLLTALRNWGYYFSPLNLYYCFDSAGDQVRAVVAEVSNTPWRETHRYVLWPPQENDGQISFEHAKDFHVSPFMEMDLRYRWQLSVPGEQIAVQIASQKQNHKFFTAQMNLQRRPLSDVELAKSLVRFPWMSGQIIAAIHWQALRLWWKKCPFYTHPKKLIAPRGTSPS